MYHQHAGLISGQDAPQVLAHLERDGPQVFNTALRGMIDNEIACRARFNSLAYNYLVGGMSEHEKQIVDGVVGNIFGYPLSTIINTAEHHLEQRTSATTVELLPDS